MDNVFWTYAVRVESNEEDKKLTCPDDYELYGILCYFKGDCPDGFIKQGDGQCLEDTDYAKPIFRKTIFSGIEKPPCPPGKTLQQNGRCLPTQLIVDNTNEG